MVVFTQPCLPLSLESPITTVWRASLVLYSQKCVHMIFLHKGSGSMTWTLHIDIMVLVISHKTLDALRLSLLVYRVGVITPALKCWMKVNSIVLHIEHLPDLKARISVSSVQPSEQSNELIIIPRQRHWDREVKQLVQSNTSLSPNLPHGTHSFPWLLCLFSSPILTSEAHPCTSKDIPDLSTWGVKRPLKLNCP